MHPFSILKVTDEQSAVKAAGDLAGSKFIAGGTNLVDLMKMNIERPGKLIDINPISHREITKHSNGNVVIGALVTNSDLAYHPLIRHNFPVLSEAILAGASPQLRNMATTGGNLLQRTRCYYFFDTAAPCNKREPGSGCSAIKGYNRIHAILGTSDHCIATHPSDMCVALAALGAIIHVRGTNSERQIPFSDFHTLPGEHPEIENVLKPEELITAVEVPALPFAKNSAYVKVRDRASYDFALASAAVALDVNGVNIKNARIALGGIGTKPWRTEETERFLVGKPVSENTFKAAADIALQNAKELKFNAFKTELAKRTLISALNKTGGIA